MPAKKTVSVKLSEELYSSILKAAGRDSVSSYVVKSVELRLAGELAPTKRAAREQATSRAETASRFYDAFGDYIASHPNWMEELPAETAGRIIAQVFPKLACQQQDDDEDVLSLKSSICSLPLKEDICGELARARQEVFRLSSELEIEKAKRIGFRVDVERREYAEKVACFFVEYVRRCVASGTLPDIGDGGGLSQKARQDVSLEVERFLKGISEAK